MLHYLLNLKTENELLHHPKLGASWEGYALEEIIRCEHLESENCFFWSTHQQAKLDLLIFKNGMRHGFEFKYSDVPKLTKSMSIAVNDLHLEQLLIIYPGNREYFLTEKIKVIGLNNYLNQLSSK